MWVLGWDSYNTEDERFPLQIAARGTLNPIDHVSADIAIHVCKTHDKAQCKSPPSKP